LKVFPVIRDGYAYKFSIYPCEISYYEKDKLVY